MNDRYNNNNTRKNPNNITEDDRNMYKKIRGIAYNIGYNKQQNLTRKYNKPRWFFQPKKNFYNAQKISNQTKKNILDREREKLSRYQLAKYYKQLVIDYVKTKRSENSQEDSQGYSSHHDSKIMYDELIEIKKKLIQKENNQPLGILNSRIKGNLTKLRRKLLIDKIDEDIRKDINKVNKMIEDDKDKKNKEIQNQENEEKKKIQNQKNMEENIKSRYY